MKNFVLYTTAFMLLPLGMFAQQTLSLNDAIGIALKNSLEIQIAKNTQSVNTINNHYGIAGGLPTVNAALNNTQQLTNLNQDLSNGTSINRNGVYANNTTANVSGSMVLYNGQRIITTKKRLEELQKLSQTQLNSVVQGVIANVMLRYYAVVQQQKFVATLEKSLEVSKQKLTVIETRKSVGMSNDADYLQAQLDVNAQTQAIQNQRLVIDQAKTDLLRTLTQKPDESIAVSDSIVVDKALQWETIKPNILKNPDIQAAEQQIVISQLLEKETIARQMPTVSLNAGVNYSRNQSGAGFTLLNQVYGPQIGVSVTMPLYTGSVNKRQEQIAKINTQTASLQRETIIQNYQANATKAWQSYQNALKQLDIEQKNFELSDKLLTLTMTRFQLGQATIVDVKLAQQTYENAGYRLNNLSYAAKLAEVNIKQLAYLLM